MTKNTFKNVVINWRKWGVFFYINSSFINKSIYDRSLKNTYQIILLLIIFLNFICEILAELPKDILK